MAWMRREAAGCVAMTAMTSAAPRFGAGVIQRGKARGSRRRRRRDVGRPHLVASLVRQAVGGRRRRLAGLANGLKAGLG
jgi:hypothetical protein